MKEFSSDGEWANVAAALASKSFKVGSKVVSKTKDSSVSTITKIAGGLVFLSTDGAEETKHDADTFLKGAFSIYDVNKDIAQVKLVRVCCIARTRAVLRVRLPHMAAAKIHAYV